jgi:hypothetical protein
MPEKKKHTQVNEKLRRSFITVNVTEMTRHIVLGNTLP